MSVVMTDQSENNVAEFLAPGPGERLRAARLSMSYDLAKIASELHLTTSVVEALEADDYADIGVRVFVRGYLRNYARIVGMPVDSILRQFDEKWPDDARPRAMVKESPTLPADGGPSRGLAGAVTWLLVIALVVLFLVWWRGYLDEIMPGEVPGLAAPQVDGPGLAASTETPDEDALLLEDDPGLADGSLQLPSPPSLQDTAPVIGAEPGPPPDSTAPAPAGLPAVTGGSAGMALAPGTGIALPSPAEISPRANGVAAVEAAVPVASTGAPVIDGTKQIVMTFSAPCWVDVRDSARKFKLFGEMPKGARKVLGGQPPYKLVIGNSRAVTISVNGQPFDLSPYAKGNVARFTLDP